MTALVIALRENKTFTALDRDEMAAQASRYGNHELAEELVDDIFGQAMELAGHSAREDQFRLSVSSLKALKRNGEHGPDPTHLLTVFAQFWEARNGYTQMPAREKA